MLECFTKNYGKHPINHANHIRQTKTSGRLHGPSTRLSPVNQYVLLQVQHRFRGRVFYCGHCPSHMQCQHTAQCMVQYLRYRVVQLFHLCYCTVYVTLPMLLHSVVALPTLLHSACYFTYVTAHCSYFAYVTVQCTLLYLFYYTVQLLHLCYCTVLLPTLVHGVRYFTYATAVYIKLLHSVAILPILLHS